MDAMDDPEIGNESMSIELEESECDFSKHPWLFIKFLLTSVCGTCVALFGIFGNVTIVAVLSRPIMRTPNNFYLTALAVFDTLLLLFAILLYSTEYIQEYFDNVDLYLIWMASTPYLYVLSNFAQTGSVYVTVSVTFERYLAVVYPKISQTQCTKPRATYLIGGVACFAALFNIPKFFEVQVVRHENCTGFASRSIAPSELLMDPIYSTVYTLWLSQFIMVFFPFAVLLTINTAIVWNFKKSLKRLDCCKVMDLDRGILKEQSRDATRVLVTIVVVFLICNCWGFVITVLESIYGGRQLSEWAPEFYAFSREAVNFLAVLNSSINFLICLIFSDDFRCELLTLYGCRRRRRQSSHHLNNRRRKGFSEGRPKLVTSSARTSRASLGVLQKMQYVDRLRSADSLTNYNSNSGTSVGESTNSLKVPSFSALIDAAHMFINGGAIVNGCENDPIYNPRSDSPTKEIENYLKVKESMSNGHLSNLNRSVYKNGPMRRGSLVCQPFLYRHSVFSDFDVESETMI